MGSRRPYYSRVVLYFSSQIPFEKLMRAVDLLAEIVNGQTYRDIYLHLGRICGPAKILCEFLFWRKY